MTLGVFEVRHTSGRPVVVSAESAGIRADTAAVDAWLAENAARLRDVVREHGAVLVRGLGLTDPAAARSGLLRLIGRPVPEREGFAPRKSAGDGIYQSSQWPAGDPMCMHHELSYVLDVPGLVGFACPVAARSGGATALADAAAVLRDLPADIVSAFVDGGWSVRRHYGGPVGMGWSEAFGTEDRAAVEDYCLRQDIECTWHADGSLSTWQRRSAVATHPSSGLPCWFNQIAFLSEWTMAPEVRGYLVGQFGVDRLPFNSYHGDGSPIDREVIDLINETYDRHTVREPWQSGDLMLVDNIRMAHSREPFEPPRTVLVGFGEPVRMPSPATRPAG